MWEFEVEDVETGERSFLFGYNFDDACERSGVDSDCYIVLYSEYID